VRSQRCYTAVGCVGPRYAHGAASGGLDSVLRGLGRESRAFAGDDSRHGHDRDDDAFCKWWTADQRWVQWHRTYMGHQHGQFATHAAGAASLRGPGRDRSDQYHQRAARRRFWPSERSSN